MSLLFYFSDSVCSVLGLYDFPPLPLTVDNRDCYALTTYLCGDVIQFRGRTLSVFWVVIIIMELIINYGQEYVLLLWVTRPSSCMCVYIGQVERWKISM